MLLSLDCGIKVRAISVECSYTYGGLIEGSPNEEVNNRILQFFQKRLDEIWGGRKNHLQLPQIDRTDPEHPLLPEAQMIAWLDYVGSSEEPLTQLVVGWFTHTFNDRPLVEIIQNDLHGLPWRELAEEYEN